VIALRAAIVPRIHARTLARPWLAAALAYTALAGVMGRHVLASAGTAIASDPGDPVLNAAILAWNATHVPWTDAWFQFPIFHPTADALTLSEHLLGVSVIATPLYWLTGNPTTTYNLALLLSYPLSGLAMYALVSRLTRSAPAAFVAGIAFAFAPYRASQLPHIQMLTTFWAPLALLGLHGFLESAGPPLAGPAPQRRPEATSLRGAGSAEGGPAWRWPWLALFAGSWALQGAANGYMLVYFSMFVVAWVLWFLVARRRFRDAGLVGVAAASAAVPLAPILYRYFLAHREMGVSRSLGEISSFGADLASPLCAPASLTVWGWLRIACVPEGELFPGVALAGICVAGAVLARVRRGHEDTPPCLAERLGAVPPSDDEARDRRSWVLSAGARAVRRVAIAIGIVFLGVAASTLVIGSWRLTLGPLTASASSPDKPLSTAMAMLLIAFLLSARFRSAVRRGSTTTFYVAAALACWVLSWGPFPRLAGVPILYQAPYAWLLQLPGTDALRVPARFWMLTVLCLSVIAGLLVARLLRAHPRRVSGGAAVVLAAALSSDAWMTIPVAVVARPVSGAEAFRGRSLLVLPAGETARDAAVVYQAVLGGWRSVNGYSGHEPPHYEALRTLAQSGDPAMYEPFVRLGALDVIDESGTVRRLNGTTTVTAALAPGGVRLGVRGSAASCAPEGLSYLTDGDVTTRWVCGIQQRDEELTIELDRPAVVGAIVHALGAVGADFPRYLIVETSPDAVTWDVAWEGSPAAAVLAAAVEAPRLTRLVVRFTPRAALYVRLRQTGRDDRNYWSIGELEVWSGER
jgi:hypothetical protein